MNILLTNDDGIGAPGLRSLYAELAARGHNVVAVAPMDQQSGVSRSLTVFKPLRVCPVKEDGFEGTGLYGTPADCVKLGLGALMPEGADLVLAGINAGPNSGPDLFYSGTVAAAAEGAQAGVPAMAISHARHEPGGDLRAIASHAADLAEKLDFAALGPGVVVNVNYPENFPEQGGDLRVCPHSRASWRNIYEERRDPRGQPYWWLVGDVPKESIGADTDRQLLADGHVTLTPLRFEFNDEAALAALRGLEGKD